MDSTGCLLIIADETGAAAAYQGQRQSKQNCRYYYPMILGVETPLLIHFTLMAVTSDPSMATTGISDGTALNTSTVLRPPVSGATHDRGAAASVWATP
ncbi:hypothetical protein SKAU_G00420070 [Synaphobranchus kaupii]|uniref:Uncharacterized protein n=1 Tax=Synaphobranchus kaupii TaxID=118154 RepID=A0A9Q1E6I2_SYNKA|nr:hypothetical protein SKAU_G00420070 [Synaphobranchus kaupii]